MTDDQNRQSKIHLHTARTARQHLARRKGQWHSSKERHHIQSERRKGAEWLSSMEGYAFTRRVRLGPIRRLPNSIPDWRSEVVLVRNDRSTQSRRAIPPESGRPAYARLRSKPQALDGTTPFGASHVPRSDCSQRLLHTIEEWRQGICGSALQS